MTESWVDALSVILRGTPKLPGALCRQRPGLFDGDTEDDVEQAAALCRRCPERQPCGDWAATLKHNQAHGVLAGQYREWVSHPSEIRPNRKVNA